MTDNFGRNNNNKIKYNNCSNKSNYVIKVKTKMNQNEKNINNFNGNKNEFITNLILESIQNVDFEGNNKNNLSDIFMSSKNHRRHCSNIVSRKYIENHRESRKEQKIILEKISFIQLWWKTIFQIIKIQKNVRGFIYRQRLIEELDREEIVVDNLLFLIKSYKKIVFNIFIYKLWNYKSTIRYFFLKWNEKINKGNIIKNLLKVYGKQNSYDNFNTSSEFIKFDYDCDKNIFRDSTNSLMNNIEILNDKNLNENIKDINDFENYLRPSVNAKENLKFNNEINDKNIKDIVKNCYDKINNNLNKKNKLNKSKNKKSKKNEVQKEKENTNYNNINININSKTKNIKQKNENDYNKNYHLVVSKPSVAPNNNKIGKKKSNNNNMINFNGNKSEFKTKTKKNKITNKLISKEIIPFSMINNNENISNLTNINPLYNSTNNIILLNKKNKIYENHLYENKKKKENKNKDDNNIIKIKKNNNIKTNKMVKKKISEPPKFQEENISSTNNTQLSHLKNNSNLNDNQIISENNHKVNPFPVSCNQNKSEISNNKNNNSSLSIETSFLNSIKSNIKQFEPNKINKYFNFWHNLSFHRAIKNRLRSISLFFKIINKIQKRQIISFFEKFKLYYNSLLFRQIKILFNKYRIKIVKKSIIKCYLYKMFDKYKEIVYKKIIVQKLKENYIESRKKMIREIHNEIKEKNNIKFERKKNIINKKELISHANQRNNKLMLDTTNINNSMLNSVNLEEHINKIIEYHYTNGSQPNQSINQIKKTLNINNNHDEKDIVSQINQLTMVINLIEHLRLKKIKNKENSLNISKYFKKWKKSGKNGIIYRENDNFKSEYELYSKSEHMSISSNSNSKYIPVRGLKCFQGKIKPKINPTNKNKKYKISNLIEKYKTTTIATTTDYSTQTYKKNEINENKLNLNNGSFKTFNDFNSLECNNIFEIRNLNNYLKVSNINQNETQIQQKQNWIYQKKTLGSSLKNNFNKNLNNTSSTNSKINNYQYANDSCFTSLDNYSSNFLNILNNANFGFNDCKIVPLILLDSGNDSESINNFNLDNEFNNKVNESFDIRNIQKKYGIQKMNKIEEKEICFFPNKTNDKNLLNINNKYKSNYEEDIDIFSEIKKYYDEDLFIIDENKMKKFNSFIFNTFNNTIIITQEVKNKRSKSK